MGPSKAAEALEERAAERQRWRERRAEQYQAPEDGPADEDHAGEEVADEAG